MLSRGLVGGAFLSVVAVVAVGPALRAQTVGSWRQPAQVFPQTWVGCGGSQEPVYAVHASLIPTGPHRGKVLFWDRSASLSCSSLLPPSGDREQRWGILDPENSVVTFFSWTIPATVAPQVYQPLPPPYTGITTGVQGLFCAGHCWLPDGRLFVVGGNDWSVLMFNPSIPFTGSRMVAIYDPLVGPDGTWSTLRQSYPTQPFLERPRWYPTAVLVYDPATPFRSVKVCVLGGIEQFDPNAANEVFYPTDRAYLTHEAFDVSEVPPATNWTIAKDLRGGGTLPPNYVPNTPVSGLFVGTKTSATSTNYPWGYSLFYYARAHYLSDSVLGGAPAFAGGITWVGGMPKDSIWIDHPVNPNFWPLPQPAITGLAEILEEPTAVLLPASLLGGGTDRIALFGGQYGLDHSDPNAITNTVAVMDAKLANPAWSTTTIPAMNYRRKFANSVLLPDSSVLIVGGGKNPAHGVKGNEVFTPEVFRGTVWQDGPPEASPRTYHSCSLLLPSGKVLSMGGDTRTHDYQLYLPHYASLPSPAIGSSPATLTYGSTFTIGFTLPAGQTLARVALTAPGSVTHSHDPNQRIVELGIVSSTSTSATIATPLNPTKAPYGHYMLWLVDSAGGVSTAAWTQLL